LLLPLADEPKERYNDPMTERETEIFIPAEPITNQDHLLAPYFGKSVKVFITFEVSDIEFIPADPGAGYFFDTCEVTDVDLLNVWVQHISADGSVESEEEFNLEKMSEDMRNILKRKCIILATTHPEWAQELADLEADRMADTLMEDRRDREYNDSDDWDGGY
jgi:hypothetical protein